MATTTNYSWSTPDNTSYVKDGASSIRTLGSSVDSTLFSVTGGKNVTLVPINFTSFTSQTNVQINNVFSSSYLNYLVTLNTDHASSIAPILRMSSGGSPNASNIVNNAGIFAAPGGGTGSYFPAVGVTYTTVGDNLAAYAMVNIFNPNVAGRTYLSGLTVRDDGQGATFYSRYNNSVQYDGLNYNTGAVNSSGQIKIYGLRNS